MIETANSILDKAITRRLIVESAVLVVKLDSGKCYQVTIANHPHFFADLAKITLANEICELVDIPDDFTIQMQEPPYSAREKSSQCPELSPDVVMAPISELPQRSTRLPPSLQLPGGSTAKTAIIYIYAENIGSARLWAKAHGAKSAEDWRWIPSFKGISLSVIIQHLAVPGPGCSVVVLCEVAEDHPMPPQAFANFYNLPIHQECP